MGQLVHDRGRLGLAYLGQPTRALAQRFPPRAEPYGDAETRTLVANLLPEGDWRAMLCRRLMLPPEDDFGLLRVLGHDCAGALTFDDPAFEHTSDAYTPLAEAELRRWLRDPMARPSPAEAPGLRRALAGAQDKLILHLVEGKPYLCERGAPSTIILKPDIPGDFELSALNELFCMRLCAAVGIPVARSFWFAGAFAVERFDRRWEAGQLVRLPQEDFAQLLGVLPSRKYEIRWRDCFALVRRHLRDADAGCRQLVDRLLFNLFIGNADAHGKNFALLESPRAVVLAPAYDLLCTQIYPSLSETFAMPIGPARRQQELTALAWQELAREAGLPLEWLKQRGSEMAGAVQNALRELPAALVADNPTLLHDIYPARRRDEFLRKLVDVMVGNCKRVARTLVARA